MDDRLHLNQAQDSSSSASSSNRQNNNTDNLSFSQQQDDSSIISVATPSKISPRLPDLELPHSNLDLTVTFDSILDAESPVRATPVAEKVQKRASNVMKLAQENEKLKEELRAMTERLQAAERRQQELKEKWQKEAAAAAKPSAEP